MSSSSPRFSSASVSCSHRPVGSAAAEPPFEPAPPLQSLFAKPPHRPARKDHPKPAACVDSEGACQRQPRTGAGPPRVLTG